METKDRNQAIIEIADIIANSVDTYYSDEKQDMIDDLYTMGGQSQYLEDMLYNNGIEDLNNYVDIIDEGLSTEELGELAKLIISKFEKEEGKQEILNEEGLKIKNKSNGIIQDEKELRKAWEEELTDELEDNETIEDRKKAYPFDKWVQDLLNTNDFEKLEESLELKTEDVEEDLELNIEQANGSVEQDLEQIEISNDELTTDIKSLMDCEKDKISKYNSFLDNMSSKLPKDVYEVIEDEINGIKENSMNNQELLNKMFNALSFIMEPQTAEASEDEVIETNDESEDIFDSLKEEGKLHFNNMNDLTEQYAMYKGLEINEDLQKQIRKTMLEKYSILEDKAYTIISSEGIKNKLLEEEKKTKQAKELENVKKEAEQNAKETGEDTYVYQSTLDGTMFFATQKPTHTALFNKVLTLGKYKVGFDHGEIITTWFKENKENDYKYKRTLNEDINKTEDTGMVAGVPDGKEVESPVGGNGIVNEATATYLFKAGEINRGEYDKLADHDSPEYKYINHEISFGEYEKLADKNSPDYKYLANEINMEEYSKLNESKEEPEIIEEIGEDYEKLTFEEYKKRNKEFIDLCYRNTWGEGEIDKDLYEDLANSIYSDSITGNINTKSDYESLNDKIEEANIETINDKVDENK